MSNVSKDELRTVGVFHDLPDEQLDWFLGHATEVRLAPGDIYIRAGAPADRMFVVLEGELQIQLEGSNENVFTISAGTVTGLLPYSRMTVFPGTGRAVQASRAVTFPGALFDELLTRMPELGRRLVATMVDRTRETTRREQQRDRLAALGKLSAGLAHELNNPAAAARRTAQQLRDILKRIKDASHDLGRRELTPTQKAEVEKLEAFLTQQNEPPPDTL